MRDLYYMGKCTKKCKSMGEVGIMEVGQAGVKTRARALALAVAVKATSSGAAKRKKLGSGEVNFASSSSIQLRSGSDTRRCVKSGETVQQDRCSSPCSDHSPASCCSSNGSTEFVKDVKNFVDLKDESVEVATSSLNCEESRREATPFNVVRGKLDDMESIEGPPEVSSRFRSKVTRTPSQADIDEFFAEVEKEQQEHQKKLAEKYNFNFAYDVPLEGRYQWVPLKQ